MKALVILQEMTDSRINDVLSKPSRNVFKSVVVCRTVRWLDRCIAAHKRPSEQSLFPIVQGGLDADLRVQCAKGMLI